ncbi:MAG: DUF4390 domain-containing protein, partial [Nitrospinota bacterium]
MPRAEAKGLGWKFAAVVVAGIFVVAWPREGAAGSSLAPLSLVKLQDQLCISTRREGGFSQTVTETITSGIPATFSYEIELWHRRPMWTDKSVVAKTFKRVVTFNSLTNEFQVAQEGNASPWGRTSKDLEEVKDWVTRVDVLPLIKIADLDPDREYYVRARAMVKTDQSHSAIKFMLFFISPFNVKTAWKESEPFVVEDL